MKTLIHELAHFGQSLWYDNIRRGLLVSGELKRLIDIGVTGVTSNPSIFDKAISDSNDYSDALFKLVKEGKKVHEIYEELIIEDIQNTADLLRPVYDRTQSLDGYVSVEVPPLLAHDTKGTIAEARRLFTAMSRPNVMIKVPATSAGLPAITTLISEGINVNVTLIFSVMNYEYVANAFIAEKRRAEAAAALGQYRHKESKLSGYLLRGPSHRPAYGQYGAATHARSLSRSRQSRRDVGAGCRRCPPVVAQARRRRY